MPWIVSQYGARQHYATPIAFERKGTLDVFYTENWAGRFRPILKKLPGRFKALGDRWSPQLPSAKVVSFDLRTMLNLSTRRFRGLRGNPSNQAVYREYIREGQGFCARVNLELTRRTITPDRTVFYGCKSVCLETLQMLHKKNVFSIVDQADPGLVEEKIVQAEREKWPDWELQSGPIPNEYYDRCRQEWDAASMVLVYSDWTRDAIIEQGAVAEKVVVIPLAYEPGIGAPRPARTVNKPFTVLWLGTVNLRKGIQYLLEAARILQNQGIAFVVAGQVMISDHAVRSAPSNVEFIGRVLRGNASAIYQSADLFVLPTVSDSFALTQVEAMANGLPVLATERCGRVVTPGVDGEIVPTADAPALAAAILRLSSDPDRLAEMSMNAYKKAQTFSLDSYADQVRAAVIARRPSLASAI